MKTKTVAGEDLEVLYNVLLSFREWECGTICEVLAYVSGDKESAERILNEVFEIPADAFGDVGLDSEFLKSAQANSPDLSVRLFGQEFCDEIDRHAADDNIRPADTSEKDQA